MPSAQTRTTTLALAALIGVGTLVGCSKAPETRTVMEVKRDYAKKLVEGMAFGDSGRIKAASFDDRTFVLRTVTIDSDTAVMTAKRAEMIVDHANDTLRLRLYEVAGASTDAEGIAESREITTGAIELGYNAVP